MGGKDSQQVTVQSLRSKCSTTFVLPGNHGPCDQMWRILTHWESSGSFEVNTILTETLDSPKKNSLLPLTLGRKGTGIRVVITIQVAFFSHFEADKQCNIAVFSEFQLYLL